MLHPLPTEVVQKLRSGIAITSVSHCVEELVINAIDANATCIAVRLNLPFFKIQVVDNGDGIENSQLEFVGVRYATSKCFSIDDLHNLKSGGFRGEALASLKDISAVLSVESRSVKSKETYCKIFTHGRPPQINKSSINRPSKGTTVTVHDFMYNMPVRKKCISDALDIEDCRKTLEKFALIHPQISFSLRNDVTGEICLETKKCNSSKSAFMYLFGEDKAYSLKEINLVKNAYDVSGYISTDGYISKDLQLAYVNKRYINRTKLQKLVSAILKKFLFSRSKSNISKDCSTTLSNHSISPSKSQIQYAVFIINVTCPYDEYDIILEPRKTLVEFINWESILKVVEEAVFQFLKNNELWLEKESSDDLSLVKNSAQNILAKNFPADLGKDIAAHNNRNGLFSMPAKRAVANADNTSIITPLKKICSPYDFLHNRREQSSQSQSIEKLEETFAPLKKNCVVPNLISKFKKVDTITPSLEHYPSVLDNFEIPDTNECLKEISKILKQKDNRNLEATENIKAKQDPLHELKKFQYVGDKKLKIHQKHEATQTEKHVSINPILEEFSESREKSKYTFGSDPNLESLKHLKGLRKHKLKLRPSHKNEKPPKKSTTLHGSVFEDKYPYVNVKKHNVLTTSNSGEIAHKSKCKDTERSVNEFNLKHVNMKQPKNHVTFKVNVSPKCKMNFSTQFSKHNKTSCSSEHRNSVEAAHKKEQKHLPRFSQIHKSPAEINISRKLLYRYNKLKYLKNRKRHSISNFSPVATNFDVQRNRTLSANAVYKGKKHSPKALMKDNFQTELKNFKQISKLENHPTLLFSQCDINDIIKQGHSIIESSPDSFSNLSTDEAANSHKNKTPENYSIADNHNWHNVFDRYSTEQLLNVEFDKPQLTISSPNFDFLPCGSKDRSNSPEFQGQEEKSFCNLSHNDSRNSIWKEVADSPPSPYFDSEKSPIRALHTSKNSETTFHDIQKPITQLHSPLSPNWQSCNDRIGNELIAFTKVANFCNNVSDKICNNSSNKSDFQNQISPIFNTSLSSAVANEFNMPSVVINEHNVKDVECDDNETLKEDCISSNHIAPSIHNEAFLGEIPNVSSIQPLPKHFAEIECVNEKEFEESISSKRSTKGLEVEDLFSNWQNPMFQKSLTEVESSNCFSMVQNSGTMYGVLNSYKFSKEAFKNLQVIGQIDQKFIACLIKDVNEELKDKRILVLFDQHAVHERVRLEELMAGFYESLESTSKQALPTPLSEPVEILLNKSEARLVTTYCKYLKRIGISLLPTDNSCKFDVHSVPGCLLERANNELKRNRTLALSSLIETIIKEWVMLLQQTRNPITVLPKTLVGILNSQACKGAIKFGDPLDLQQCTFLLESLSTCNLPFQCAHGRPSLAPLLDLEKIDKQSKKHLPHLSKLREAKNGNHIT